MKQGDLVTGIVIEKSQSLTLEEFCQATNTSEEVVLEMMEYHLLQPEGKAPNEWRFDSVSLRRGRIAASFYNELQINWQGVALALELLSEVEELRRQIALLKKTPHF